MSSSQARSPLGYQGAPPWPSLYWPFGPNFDPLNPTVDMVHSLYYLQDIWRFTALWSIIFSLIVYFPAGLWALFMLARYRTLRWYILLLIPFVFIFAGALASFVIGSVIGVALAAVYSSGVFTMSTWIPFLWALIHILIVLIGSYSTVTAIL